MDIEAFQSLPTAEVARLVRAAGTKTCVFPLKGTRRWFLMEHALPDAKDPARVYLDATMKRSIELYRLIFDHGIDALLTPTFSPDVMARGEDYMQMAAKGLARPATHPEYLAFYEEYGVRVRFYGDYRKYLDPTPHAYLSDLFDEVTARTMAHDRHRLFYGLFAHDPCETVAGLAVRYYLEHGRVPDKQALVEMYYGEYVGPVDFFIGFGKLRAFDMPLVATGREDLYFTISPSLYLTQPQLRTILYDHLWARTRTKADLQPAEVNAAVGSRPAVQTGGLSADDLASMKRFYKANLGRTLGVGTRHQSGRWHPLPQVKALPDPAERPKGGRDDM